MSFDLITPAGKKMLDDDPFCFCGRALGFGSHRILAEVRAEVMLG